MTGLLPALAATFLAIVVAAAAGFAFAALFLPRGRAFFPERLGWGIVLGLGALSLGEAACIAVSARPSRLALLGVLAAAALAGLTLAGRDRDDSVAPGSPRGPFEWILLAAVLAGVLLAALRALAEPMWSNDFLAIWGLKGKSLAVAGAFPAWLSDPDVAGYSHPEYPLGLPLLFAGVATLVGGWEDQALALLYPVFQIAGILVLFGWLRRRGVGVRIALVAAALLALFEPLSSAFLTGTAEGPLSVAMLLVGVSLSDALDATDRRSIARLAAAALVAASLKNEGLFVAGVAGILALLSRGNRPRRIVVAAAALVPALGSALLARAVRGPAPLRDFDFALLLPSGWSELLPRLAETVRVDTRLAVGAWPILLGLAVLFACGRSAGWADRLLTLAAAALLTYLVLPAFAVLGPGWLAATTLFRTTAALGPLAAAGLAGRLRGLYSGGGETAGVSRR